MSILPKAIYRFTTISIKIPMAYFTKKKTKQNIPNIFMETGKTPNRKAVLRKSKAGSITLPDFKLYYKAKVIN